MKDIRCFFVALIVKVLHCFQLKFVFFEKEKAKEIKAMIDIPVKLFSYYVDDEI